MITETTIICGDENQPPPWFVPVEPGQFATFYEVVTINRGDGKRWAVLRAYSEGGACVTLYISHDWMEHLYARTLDSWEPQ